MMNIRFEILRTLIVAQDRESHEFKKVAKLAREKVQEMDRKRTEKELRAKIQEERGAPKAVRPDAPAKNEAEAARAATEESRQKPATPRQGAAAAGPSEPSSAHRRRSSTPAELREFLFEDMRAKITLMRDAGSYGYRAHYPSPSLCRPLIS